MREKIGVVGAGLMGAEIGLVFALAGYDVVLSDTGEAQLSAAGPSPSHRAGAIRRRGRGAALAVRWDRARAQSPEAAAAAAERSARSPEKRKARQIQPRSAAVRHLPSIPAHSSGRSLTRGSSTAPVREALSQARSKA